jgi:hypothetical protein
MHPRAIQLLVTMRPATDVTAFVSADLAVFVALWRMIAMMLPAAMPSCLLHRKAFRRGAEGRGRENSGHRCGSNHSLFEGGELGVSHIAEPFGNRIGRQRSITVATKSSKAMARSGRSQGFKLRHHFRPMYGRWRSISSPWSPARISRDSSSGDSRGGAGRLRAKLLSNGLRTRFDKQNLSLTSLQ